MASNDYRWQTHWGSIKHTWVSPLRLYCLPNDMLSISIEPIPTFCKLDPQERSLAIFQSKHNHCIWNVFEPIIGKVSFMLKQLLCLTFINSYIAPQIAMFSESIGSMSNRCRPNGICYLWHIISSYTIEWQVPTDIVHYCLTTSASV